MSTMTITDAGRAIIANAISGAGTGSAKYWIGYYGLAYVDHSLKEGDEYIEQITPGMTKLTQRGDYIYNIWQGDLTNTGFADNDSSGAKSLFGLTMYDKNICSNYRYVMDIDGRNNLVAWTSGGTNGAEDVKHREAYHIYRGYDIETKEASGIPVPAPLFYYNDPMGSVDTLNQPGDITPAKFDENLGGKEGASSDYPHAYTSESGTDSLPMVSDDSRYYTGYTAFGALDDFNSAIGCNAGEWISAEKTRMDDGIALSTKYAQLRSISNYNLQHGTVSSEGYNLSSISACHNMSKATKLFPINTYTVLADGAGANGDPETTGSLKATASSIKFGISLSPITRDKTYLDVIDNNGRTDEEPIVDDNETNLYETKTNRFKFNRIGLYAVRMEVRRFSEQIDTSTCSADHVQFEIINDSDPVLFAVADINETVISDSGNGVGRIELEFVLHMDDESSDSSLIRDTGIFYNMYENSAITWYQNQLLASAGLSEAVTSLGIDVANLKGQIGKSTGETECQSDNGENTGIDISLFAKVNHTHAFMKNLVDGTSKVGSVRGIDTVEDGVTIGDESIAVGNYTLQMGYNTYATGDYSLVQGVDVESKGDGNFVIGADHAYVDGDGNAVIGAAMPVSMVNESVYNTVTAMYSGAVGLSESSGNLTFGVKTELAEGESSAKFSVSDSHSTLLFGNTQTPPTRDVTTVDDEGNTVVTKEVILPTYMTYVKRSIVSMNAAKSRSVAGIYNVKDSILLDTAYQVKNVNGSMIVGSSRAYGSTRYSIIGGGSESHSVQYEEKVVNGVRIAGATDTDTPTFEHIASGATDNGSTTENIVWLGVGNQYGAVKDSLIIGSGNSVGVWEFSSHSSDLEPVDRTTGSSDASDSCISVVGEANRIGISNINVMVTGSNNSITKCRNVGIIGDSNNYNGVIRSYSSVKEFMDHYSEIPAWNADATGFGFVYCESDNTIVKFLNDGYSIGYNAETHVGADGYRVVDKVYDSEGKDITAQFSNDKVGTNSYIMMSGRNVVERPSGGGWAFYNNEKDWYCGAAAAKNATWGFKRAVIGYAEPTGISGTMVIGSSNKLGSDSFNSLVIGSGNAYQYVKLNSSMIVANGFKFGMPGYGLGVSGAIPTDYIQKEFNRVLLLGADEHTGAGISRFTNSNYEKYTDSLIFLGGLFVPTATSELQEFDRKISWFLGTTSTWTANGYTYYDAEGTGINFESKYAPIMTRNADGTAKWTAFDAKDGVNRDVTSHLDASSSETQVVIYEQNKPAASMVYTSGIALAGNSMDSTYGMLKLGSYYPSIGVIESDANDTISQYAAWGTDGWQTSFYGNKRYDIYDVKLITGTAQCPYAGRTLVVDHTQELDGTFHIKLGDPVHGLYNATYGEMMRYIGDCRDSVKVWISSPEDKTAVSAMINEHVYWLKTTCTAIGKPMKANMAVLVHCDSTVSLTIGNYFHLTDNGGTRKCEEKTLSLSGWYRFMAVSVVDSDGNAKLAWTVEKIHDGIG